MGAIQQADFDENVGNLSGGAKQAYDNVLERGYTPQQALAYAQDFQGIESPISRPSVGTPSIGDLSFEDFAGPDLSGLINDAASMPINIAPATATANREVAQLNAAQPDDGVPFYLDRNSGPSGGIEWPGFKPGQAIPTGRLPTSLGGTSSLRIPDPIGAVQDFINEAFLPNLSKRAATTP